jgi:ABC-type antimicrobial peptide transport system permease subunit
VYLPSPGFAIAAPSWSVLVRSDLSAESLLPAIRSALRTEEPDAALDHVKSMDDVVSDSVSAQRIVATLLLCFAVLALVLASLGLYSLVTFSVVARLPELAIRSALGSTPGALVALVGREGIALVAAGLGIGLAAVVPLRPLLTKFVFDVGQIGALVFGAVLLTLSICAAVAVAVPALRAARIDPIRVLRNQ